MAQELPQASVDKAADPVRRVLHDLTVNAAEELIEHEPDGSVRCFACGHRCLVRPGKEGICRVRFNEGGTLRVPFGYVNGIACDPVEKKPFFHFLPGSDIVTFGMLGCDFHCGYCQNWISSQVLRDPNSVGQVYECRPEQVATLAKEQRAPVVASSYNEPLITGEWAVAVFKEAKQRGLRCAMISNGNATPQALDYLQPWIDAYKVDLKSFSDRSYRQLGGVLETVLQTIRSLNDRGIWCEIVTLLVPGFNDAADELKAMAGFLAGVNPLMPWHITAFHPDYKMTEQRATRPEDLLQAAEYGKKAGLRYIYLGNLSGRLGEWEDTQCHQCGLTLVKRRGFVVSDVAVKDGRCPKCQTQIPGIWS